MAQPDLPTAIRIVASAVVLHPEQQAALDAALSPDAGKALADANQALADFDANHGSGLVLAVTKAQEAQAGGGVTPPSGQTAKQAAVAKATADKATADANLAAAQGAEVLDETAVANAQAAQTAAAQALADANALP